LGCALEIGQSRLDSTGFRDDFEAIAGTRTISSLTGAPLEESDESLTTMAAARSRAGSRENMRFAVATTILMFAAAGAASAETFSFKSTSKTVNSIQIATGASSSMGAGFSEGSSQATYGSGLKATNTFNCAVWSALAGSRFTDEGVCAFTEGTEDKATIEFSCVSDQKAGAGDCWGALRGVAGRFTGKTGTISWHQTNSADGKTASSIGAGLWND
jgi:hypothetical protein